MGANLHYFHVAKGHTVAGMKLPHLALCEVPPKPSPDAPRPDPIVQKVGRGLLLGTPSGVLDIEGQQHLILKAGDDGKLHRPDVRALWSGEDADAPRFVVNSNNGVELAAEASIVQIGPRQYTISRRKEDDGTHTIHVRTGLVRWPGQTEEAAVKVFFAQNKVEKLGFHGSFALKNDVKHVAGVEDEGEEASKAHPVRLDWRYSQGNETAADGLSIPFSRDDVWRIPEGCKIIVVDPAIRRGRQITFVVSVENDVLKTRLGGQREFDQFMELELKRRRKRLQERDRRQANREA